MSRYQMARKKTGEGEETDQLLLRPRVTLIKQLEDAARKAKRFTNRNQVAIEILEAYLPFWEEIERQREAGLDAQFQRMRAALSGDVAVFAPRDTHAPAARDKGTIEGTWSGEQKDCPNCGTKTAGFVCPECGSPAIDAEFLSKASLDALPFGVIRLASDGTILDFNKAERELSRVAHKKLVGKNFFTEIAPCTKVKKFRDRFRKFLAGTQPSDNFEFTYTFPFGTARVFILFFRQSEGVGYIVSSRAREQRAQDTG